MAEPSVEPVDILIVDDQPRNLLALAAILEQPGYRCITALSGAEALKLVLAQTFAVILLDVLMPGMDGLEVAALIKARERSRGTPIIFLTAAGEDLERIHQAYSLGAVDYLAKPIHPDVVRAKVDVFVELYRRTEEVKRQAGLLREHDRRERERQLEEVKSASERRYRDLAESIPQLVWRAGPDGAVTYFTKRWREYTGAAVMTGDGFAWLNALHPGDRDEFLLRWLGSVARDRHFQAECRLRRADGEHRWHLCQALPETDSAGNVVGWMGTFTDIDAQRRVNEERAELLRAAETARAKAEEMQLKAQQAIDARDEFLSIASHELRTPVTSLSLQIQTLARSARGEAREPLTAAGAARQIEAAERQVARLSALLATLFDVSRIVAGRITLDRQRVDLCQVVRDVGARFALSCADEGSHLEVRTNGEIVGRWDALRLGQAIDNLVSNALKYGGGRPIEIAAQSSGDVATVRVVDHGVGIAPENHARIFERFERATSSISHGGLGLGLYITKSLVTAHGGAIDVESVPGEGATFRMTLPMER